VTDGNLKAGSKVCHTCRSLSSTVFPHAV